MFFFRIGLAFSATPDSKVNGYADAGVALLRAYDFVSQDKGPGKGLSFITDVRPFFSYFILNRQIFSKISNKFSLPRKHYFANLAYCCVSWLQLVLL